MKPRSTSTIIEKTEKAELVRVEFKGKTFYRVFFNIRPNDGTGLPGYSTMCDIQEGFGDDEGAARAFFEEKKNGEPAPEETPVVKEDLTTEQTVKETDMAENKMMKITEEGKALIERNGGILKIQALESSGDFDYSDCKDWDEVFEKWADEVGGWNYYEGTPKESDDSEVYSAEESKERLLEDFNKVKFETTIDECIENGDMYGIARKFGYLEEIDED